MMADQSVIHTISFAKEAADFIAARAKEALKDQNFFVLGLCGGKTPEQVYANLAKDHGDLDWRKIVLTFGDERCFPPDHQESNFRMANEALIKHIPIPSENVFRMAGEMQPDEAAKIYERQLRELARKQGKEIIQHDLLLLGIGDDGHTASLFPGTDALKETEKLVVANFVPKFDSYRLTMTYKAINNARRVCFLANDPHKSEVVEKVMRGDQAFPASKVTVEKIIWILGY